MTWREQSTCHWIENVSAAKVLSTFLRIGIIHIDECDKLARRGGGGDGAWGGRDVGGEGVQQGI